MAPQENSTVDRIILALRINLDKISLEAIRQILLGNNCAIIQGSSNDDDMDISLSYLIPICAKMGEDKQIQSPKNGIPDGPIAIILTSSMTGEKLKRILDFIFNENEHGQQIISYPLNDRKSHSFVSSLNEDTMEDLKYGVDILVTTPTCFLQMIEKSFVTATFNRLEHLICDDCHILLDAKEVQPFENFIEYIRQEIVYLGHRALGIGLQYIFCGRKWTPALDYIVKHVVDDTVVIKSSQLPVTFTKVKWMEVPRPQDTICPELLSFGQCSSSEYCFFSHDIPNYRNPLLIDKSEVEVFITKSEDVSNYLGQLVASMDLNENKYLSYEHNWLYRCELLQNYYAEEENRKPVTSFSVNKMVAVKVHQNMIVRATIQEILRDSCNRPKSLGLFCVDTSQLINCLIKETEIFILPKRKKKLFQLGVRVILVGLKPPNDQADYDATQNSMAMEFTEGKVLRGKISGYFGNTIFMDSPKTSHGRSLKQDFKKFNLATDNPNHVEQLLKLNKLNIPS